MESRPTPVTGYPVPPQSGTNAPPHSYSGGGAVAYPYPAPPSQNGYYNNVYSNQPYSNLRPTFFRRFIAAMIAVFIIIGTILFIVWLVLRPRVPEFRVDSVSATAFNLSAASQVTGNFNVGFTVSNPNKKMSVSYDQIESTLYYEWDFIAVTAVPPFDQGTRNQTAVSVAFAASGAYIDSRVWKDLSADRSRGSASFNVKLLARVRFKAGAWRPRSRLLRVLCRDLAVNFPSGGGTGKLAGGSRDCRVAL